MKIHVLLGIALLATTTIAPSAASDAAAGVCTPPVSQFGACVGQGCVVVDGPAMHSETCLDDAAPVGGIPECDPPNTPVCTYRNAQGDPCYAVYYGKHPVVQQCVSPRAAAAASDLPEPTDDACVSSGTMPELRVCATYWGGWLCVFGTYGRMSVVDECVAV